MKKSKISVNTSQLASILNLSPSTVSLVLNGHGNKMRISKATQERVLETARQYGIQPKAHNSRLSKTDDKNKRYFITVMSPYLKGVKNVLGSIIYGLQEVILEERLPIEIIFHPYYQGELRNCKKHLSSSYPDGAIITGLSDDDVEFLLERDFDIPIVLYNRATEKYSSVYVDDYDAGKQVASIFCDKGLKNVALITPHLKSKSSSLRQLGFLDGCRNFDMNIEPYHMQEDELNYDGGYRAAVRLLEHKVLPSALFIVIDNMAPGAVKALKEKNRNPR